MATRLRNNSKLFLIRHGQSIYNLENRFTGWKDVDLTKNGVDEAKNASKLLNIYTFDYAYTSVLKRAVNTLNIIFKENNTDLNIIRDAALNERDYGDLVGQNKKEASIKFGADMVQQWRRSYNIPPPNGESLEMTYKRTIPFFISQIKPKLVDSNNIIISAHGNSIRSIVMYLFNYSKEEILKTEIGWCEPWIFTFNKNNLIDFTVLTRPNCKSNSFYPSNPIKKRSSDEN